MANSECMKAVCQLQGTMCFHTIKVRHVNWRENNSANVHQNSKYSCET